MKAFFISYIIYCCIQLLNASELSSNLQARLSKCAQLLPQSNSDPNNCQLSVTFKNITSALDKNEQQIWITWRTNIQSTTISNSTLNTNQKIINITFMLKKFFNQYESIKLKLTYIKLGSCGNINNFIGVGYEVLISNSKDILVYDNSQNNQLFNALENGINNNNDQIKSSVKQLISDFKSILSNSSQTYIRKQSSIYSSFQKMFLNNPNWKSLLLNINIPNYGKIEYYYDITAWYYQLSTLKSIIGENVSNNVLLQTLEKNSQESSTDVNTQIKTYYNSVENAFNQDNSVSNRLSYTLQYAYEIYNKNNTISRIFEKISLGSWGTIYDLLFYSLICINNQCDDLDESQQPTSLSPDSDTSISYELRLRYSLTNLMVVTTQNGVINTQLTMSFEKINTILTVEVKEIWINWINEIRTNVISNSNLNNDEKIVQISNSLYSLFNKNENLKTQLINQRIGSWGSIKDLLLVSYDIQSDKIKEIISLDSNNNSGLITALQTLPKSQESMTTVVNRMIVDITTILKSTTLNYVQKQADIYNVIEKIIVTYPENKTTLNKLEIPNFGSIETFIAISSKYYQLTTVNTVIGGTVNNNVLLKTLEQRYQNTSYSENQRTQIKQLYTNLNKYFNENEKPSMRISYISKTIETLVNNDSSLKQIIEQISLGNWGTISDIQYSEYLYKKNGNIGVDDSPINITEPTNNQNNNTLTSSIKNNELRKTTVENLITVYQNSKGETVSKITESFLNISQTITNENEKTIIINWTNKVQSEIISNTKLTNSQKITKLFNSLTVLFSQQSNIKTLILYENINTWGTISDFINVGYEILIENTKQIVTLNSQSSSVLIETIKKVSISNTQISTVVQNLITQITQVLQTTTISFTQQQAKIYSIFQTVFSQNAEVKNSLINVEIENYGTIQNYFDVTLKYYQLSTVNKVISGTSESNIYLTTIKQTSTNSQVTQVVQLKLQELYETISKNFTTNTETSNRLLTIVEESYKIYNKETTFKKVYEQIYLSEWGYISDLIFSTQLFIKNGKEGIEGSTSGSQSSTIQNTLISSLKNNEIRRTTVEKLVTVYQNSKGETVSQFTESFINISQTITNENEKTIIINWTNKVQSEIITNTKLTNIQKVTKLFNSLTLLFSQQSNIKTLILYENINTWGSISEFINVGYEILIENTKQIVTLNSQSSSVLIETIKKVSISNTQISTVVQNLITQITQVFQTTTISFTQQQAKIYSIFQTVFSQNAEVKNSLINVEIENYGTIQNYFDVTLKYYQLSTVNKVISGTSESNIYLTTIKQTSTNSQVTQVVQLKLQELYETISKNFTTNTETSNRLLTIVEESYKIYNKETTFKKVYEQIYLSEWGYISDLIFSSQLFIKNGKEGIEGSTSGSQSSTIQNTLISSLKNNEIRRTTVEKLVSVYQNSKGETVSQFTESFINISQTITNENEKTIIINWTNKVQSEIITNTKLTNIQKVTKLFNSLTLLFSQQSNIKTLILYENINTWGSISDFINVGYEILIENTKQIVTLNSQSSSVLIETIKKVSISNTQISTVVQNLITQITQVFQTTTISFTQQQAKIYSIFQTVFSQNAEVKNSLINVEIENYGTIQNYFDVTLKYYQLSTVNKVISGTSESNIYLTTIKQTSTNSQVTQVVQLKLQELYETISKNFTTNTETSNRLLTIVEESYKIYNKETTFKKVYEQIYLSEWGYISDLIFSSQLFIKNGKEGIEGSTSGSQSSTIQNTLISSLKNNEIRRTTVEKLVSVYQNSKGETVSQFTESFINISQTITNENEKTIIINWTNKVQSEIITNTKLTNIQKVTKLFNSLTLLFSQQSNIKTLILYENINTWGSISDFINVGYEILIENTKQIVTLNSQSSSVLIETIKKVSISNTQISTVVQNLITQITQVFQTTTISFTQQQAKIYSIFQTVFSQNAEVKNSLINVEIENYGTIQNYFDVTLKYYQLSTVNKVISGTSESNIYLTTIKQTSTNSQVTQVVQLKLQELYETISKNFTTNTETSNRLLTIVEESYKIYNKETTFKKVYEQIYLSEWGYISDLIFSSQLFIKNGKEGIEGSTSGSQSSTIQNTLISSLKNNEIRRTTVEKLVSVYQNSKGETVSQFTESFINISQTITNENEKTIIINWTNKVQSEIITNTKLTNIQKVTKLFNSLTLLFSQQSNIKTLILYENINTWGSISDFINVGYEILIENTKQIVTLNSQSSSVLIETIKKVSISNTQISTVVQNLITQITQVFQTTTISFTQQQAKIYSIFQTVFSQNAEVKNSLINVEIENYGTIQNYFDVTLKYYQLSTVNKVISGTSESNIYLTTIKQTSTNSQVTQVVQLKLQELYETISKNFTTNTETSNRLLTIVEESYKIYNKETTFKKVYEQIYLSEWGYISDLIFSSQLFIKNGKEGIEGSTSGSQSSTIQNTLISSLKNNEIRRTTVEKLVSVYQNSKGETVSQFTESFINISQTITNENEKTIIINWTNKVQSEIITNTKLTNIQKVTKLFNSLTLLFSQQSNIKTLILYENINTWGSISDFINVGYEILIENTKQIVTLNSQSSSVLIETIKKVSISNTQISTVVQNLITQITQVFQTTTISFTQQQAKIYSIFQTVFSQNAEVKNSLINVEIENYGTIQNYFDVTLKYYQLSTVNKVISGTSESNIYLTTIKQTSTNSQVTQVVQLKLQELYETISKNFTTNTETSNRLLTIVEESYKIYNKETTFKKVYEQIYLSEWGYISDLIFSSQLFIKNGKEGIEGSTSGSQSSTIQNTLISSLKNNEIRRTTVEKLVSVYQNSKGETVSQFTESFINISQTITNENEKTIIINWTNKVQSEIITNTKLTNIQKVTKLFNSLTLLFSQQSNIKTLILYENINTWGSISDFINVGYEILIENTKQIVTLNSQSSSVLIETIKKVSISNTQISTVVQNLITQITQVFQTTTISFTQQQAKIYSIFQTVFSQNAEVKNSLINVEIENYGTIQNYFDVTLKYYQLSTVNKVISGTSESNIYLTTIKQTSTNSQVTQVVQLKLQELYETISKNFTTNTETSNRLLTIVEESYKIYNKETTFKKVYEQIYLSEWGYISDLIFSSQLFIKNGKEGIEGSTSGSQSSTIQNTLISSLKNNEIRRTTVEKLVSVYQNSKGETVSQFTESFINISQTITNENEKTIIINWTNKVQSEIITNTKLTNIQKVTKLFNSLTLLFSQQSNIKTLILYENINTWGSISDFINVGYEILIENTKQIVTLNSQSSSVLIETIKKVSISNTQISTVVQNLITQITQVFQTTTISFTQQQAKIYSIFQTVFSQNAEVKNSLINVEIENYGTIQNYFDVTLKYYQLSTVNKVISGTSESNIYLTTIKQTSTNSQVTQVVQLKLQELYETISKNFTTNTETSNRLLTIVEESYKIYNKETTFKKVYEQIYLSEWGYISDLIFSSQLFIKNGKEGIEGSTSGSQSSTIQNTLISSLKNNEIRRTTVEKLVSVYQNSKGETVSQFTESFINISQTITNENEKTIIINWTNKVQSEIITNTKLTNIQKVTKLFNSLTLLFSQQSNIKTLILYENINTWGSISDFINVGYEILIENTKQIVTLNSQSSSVLIETIKKVSISNTQISTVVQNLITQITQVLQTTTISFTQQQAKIYSIFQTVFSQNAEVKNSLINVEIENYGTIQNYFDVTLKYYQLSTVNKVISGTSESNIYLTTIKQTSTNSQVTQVVQLKLQELYETISKNFTTNTETSNRLLTIIEESYKIYNKETTFKKVYEQIYLNEWGYISDLIFSSQLFIKNGKEGIKGSTSGSQSSTIQNTLISSLKNNEIRRTTVEKLVTVYQNSKGETVSQFTESFINISQTITNENEKTIIINWTNKVQSEIITNTKLTNIQKVTKLFNSLTLLFSQQSNIKTLILYENINTWGSISDFINVGYEILIENTKQIVTLNSQSSSVLIETIKKVSISNTQISTVVQNLITQITQVFQTTTISFTQQQAKIYSIFQTVFSQNAEVKNSLINVEIENYGTIQNYFDVTLKYYQLSTVNKVISGTSESNIYLTTIKQTSTNSQVTQVVQLKLQELYETISKNFTTNTETSNRLLTIVEESYKIYNKETTFKKVYEQIYLSEWGYISDLIFSARLNIILGGLNLDDLTNVTTSSSIEASTPNYYSSTNWPISNDYLKQRDSLSDLVKAIFISSDGLVNCQLIDYFNDITKLLKTDDQRQQWTKWVKDIQKNIISNSKFSNIQKVSFVAFDLNKFLNNNTNIKTQLFFENLGDWGTVKDMILVGFDIQIDKTKYITALNSQNTNALVTAILNTFKNDVQNIAIIKQLTTDIIKVYQSKNTYVHQQSEAYNVIKEFFEENKNSELKITVNNIVIEDYGSFEYFFGCVIWFKKVVTVKKVLSEPSLLLVNLQKAYQNTTYTTNVQNELKEIYQNINVYFQKNQTISSRLSYVVEETNRAYQIDKTLNKYFESIDLGTWGYVFEILFVFKIGSKYDKGDIDSTLAPEITTPEPATLNPYATTSWPLSSREQLQRENVVELVITYNSDNQCLLISYFNNLISLLASDDQKLWKNWIQNIETTIISNNTYINKSIEKVTRVAFSLNNFFQININIKNTLFYKQLGTWGSVKEFIFVGFEIQIEKTKNIVTLNSSNNNILVNSILNSIKIGNAENSEQFKVLANNMLQILQTKSDSSIDTSSSFSPQLYVQQQAKLYDLIESFITSNPDKKAALFNIEISNYGLFDFYYQSTSWFKKLSNVQSAVSGSGAQNSVTLALDKTFKNTSISVSIRLQIKQLYSKIVGYYNEKNQTTQRLAYLTEQTYLIYQPSPFLDQYIEKSTVGSFGHIYDVLFCSRIGSKVGFVVQ